MSFNNIAILIIIVFAFIVSFYLVNSILRIIKTLINKGDYEKTDLVKVFLSMGIMFSLLIAFLFLFTIS